MSSVEFREAVLLPPSHRLNAQNQLRIQSNQGQNVNQGKSASDAKKQCTWFGQGLSMMNGANSTDFSEFGFNFGFEKTGKANNGVFNSSFGVRKTDIPMTVPVKTEDLQKTGTVTVPPVVVDEKANASESPAAEVQPEAPVIVAPEASSNKDQSGGNNNGQSKPKPEIKSEDSNPFAKVLVL